MVRYNGGRDSGWSPGGKEDVRVQADEKRSSVPRYAGLPSPFGIAAYHKYASLLRISGAPASEAGFRKAHLHLPACRSLGAGRGIFDQPEKIHFPASAKGFVIAPFTCHWEEGEKKNPHLPFLPEFLVLLSIQPGLSHVR